MTNAYRRDVSGTTILLALVDSNQYDARVRLWSCIPCRAL